MSAQERLGVVSKQKGNISASAKIIWKISAKIQYRASLINSNDGDSYLWLQYQWKINND